MRWRSNVWATLLVAACSGAAAAPSPTPTPAASVTTSVPAPAPSIAAPSSTVAAPAPSAPSRRSDAERARARARLAEGRRADAAGDHAAALAAFDDVLAVVPDDPRLLCEAGFVAHRAGRSALAAARIDAALVAFGPPGTQQGTEATRLAQCLYNRGLVDEARGDLTGAADHFRTSLALRPNATVSAALARVTAHAAGPSAGDTMGGVPVEVAERSILVHTSEREVLVRALRAGFAGASPDGDGRMLDARSVTPLAEQDGVLVYRIDTVDYAYENQSVVVARAEEGGFRIVLAAEEYANADRGDSNTLSGTRIAALGPYVRIDYDVSSTYYVSAEDFGDDEGADAIHCESVSVISAEGTRTIVCRTTPQLACFSFPSRGESRDDVERSCWDASDHEVDPPDAGTSPSDAYALTLGVEDAARLTIGTSGAAPSYVAEAVGTHTFEALSAGAQTHASTASGHTDRERAAAEREGGGEDEDEGGGEEEGR